MEQLPVALKEEELSEMQLRFLALQSASKKWHQKEQQVMKRSKDRITKVTQEKNGSTPAAAPSRRVTTRSISSSSSTRTSSPAAETRSKTRSKTTLERDRTKTTTRLSDRDKPKGSSRGPQERSRTPGKAHLLKKFLPGKTKTRREDWWRRKLSRPNHQDHLSSCLRSSCDERWLSVSGSATKQAVRKQQLRAWKLQQQREEEEDRRQEEEERRKREEEIRRIRDLSNQDEQYNRFMKLVGGKTRTSSRVRARQPPWCGGRGRWVWSGCAGLTPSVSSSQPIESTEGQRGSKAWMPRETSTSTTTTMRSPWIRTARLDLQVRAGPVHSCPLHVQPLNSAPFSRTSAVPHACPAAC